MILGLKSMSFHKNSFDRMDLQKPHISDSDLISINYVGIDSLFFMKIALFGINSCRCVRFC